MKNRIKKEVKALVTNTTKKETLLDRILNGSDFHGNCDWNKFGQTKMTKNVYNIYTNCDKKIEQFEKFVNNWKQLKQESKIRILDMFTKDEIVEYLNSK